METNNITNIILLIAIVFITIGITRKQQPPPEPIKETIRYIPRSLEEEGEEPVRVGDIFKSMFENQTPWIGNFNDKNLFLRKTLAKVKNITLGEKEKEKEKKLKISGNKLNTLSDKKLSEMDKKIKDLTKIIDEMTNKTSKNKLEKSPKKKSKKNKKNKKKSKKDKKKKKNKKKKIDPNDINDNDKQAADANKINKMSIK